MPRNTAALLFGTPTWHAEMFSVGQALSLQKLPVDWILEHHPAQYAFQENVSAHVPTLTKELALLRRIAQRVGKARNAPVKKSDTHTSQQFSQIHTDCSQRTLARTRVPLRSSTASYWLQVLSTDLGKELLYEDTKPTLTTRRRGNEPVPTSP